MKLFTKTPLSAHKVCRNEPKPKCHPHRWVNTKQCLSCLPSHNSNSDEKTTRVKNNPKCTVREVVTSVLSPGEWAWRQQGWSGGRGQEAEAGEGSSFPLAVWDHPTGLWLSAQDCSPDVELGELKNQSPYKKSQHDQNPHSENKVRL